MSWFAGMTALAAMSTVMGGWFALSYVGSRTRVSYVVALSGGLLLGLAFFAAIPEAVRASRHGMLFVAAGFLGLLALGRCSTHLREKDRPASASVGAVVAAMLLHSFVEGILIGVVGASGHHQSWFAVVAMLLHKLPEGFGLAAVMLLARQPRSRSLLAAAGVGLAMLAGALAASLGSTMWRVPAGVLMGLTAGSFLYIGATDILPGVARKGWVHIWLATLGVLLVQATTLLA